MAYETGAYNSVATSPEVMMAHLGTDLDSWEADGFHLVNLIHCHGAAGECQVLVVVHKDGPEDPK